MFSLHFLFFINLNYSIPVVYSKLILNIKTKFFIKINIYRYPLKALIILLFIL